MSREAVEKRFRFIPYRKRDIAEMCIDDGQLGDRAKSFRLFYKLLTNTYHFEFHKVAESLKDAYASIDPDSDTRPFTNTEQTSDDTFANLLGSLLEKANYERVTEADLKQALVEYSLFKVRLHVNFDDFSDVLLFCRGESVRQENVSTWLGLRSKTIEFANYERVVVYIRFRDDYQPEKSGLPPCKPGSTLLKLFQNVPKADLEMLFPNTSVRMRFVDKLMIGVPAAVSGAIILTTKLAASLAVLGSLIGFWLGISNRSVEIDKATMIILLAGVGTLGGYLWKQFSSFKNRKLVYMQALTQNLYFKNLDNNAGVFHRLINDAEEEECKEAMLAYYFLSTSERSLNRAELDQMIESWLAEKWNCIVDFEIDDAIEKLLALHLISEVDGKLSAVSIDDALRILDQQWDDYFTAPER